MTDNELPSNPHPNLVEIERRRLGQRHMFKKSEFDRFQSLVKSRMPVVTLSEDKSTTQIVQNIWLCRCNYCDQISIWTQRGLAWPKTSSAPPPNPDMPEKVRLDYEEARSILEHSPRGSAALLRLAIDRLCSDLQAHGDTLNDKIAALVSSGLPEEVQQALDLIRVIGNNAVHPGQIDLRDDRETAVSLFDFVNIVVDSMISRKRQISRAFDKLPEGAKESIKVRDQK